MALDGHTLADIKSSIEAKFDVVYTRRGYEKLKLTCERILKAPSNFRYWCKDVESLRLNLETYKENTHE